MENNKNEQDPLLSYFTDMDHLRSEFSKRVNNELPNKKIFSIYGVGGVGKSSLLKMFRLNCKSDGIPVALVSGEDAKSPVEILLGWADDLKDDGIKMPSFWKTMDHYRSTLAKVGEKSKKQPIADIASKAASKTAETASGALIGAAVGSIFPVIGTAIGSAVGGIIGGMGADALIDALRGQGFAKEDIDLILDPSKKLTTDFMSDLNGKSKGRVIVLMLDTFEQLDALDNWMCNFAQSISENILLVIAGREALNWDKQWNGWLAQTEIFSLEPMNTDNVRVLVNRYYSTMVGGEPDLKQVDAIVKFARGLPVVVTSAVRLWVKYKQDFDFETAKSEVIGDLIQRLREGIPLSMFPLLQAAAAVRWFNKPILRIVSGSQNIDADYEELRRFPFVKSSKQGLRLHDSVREILDESFFSDDVEQYIVQHKRAAKYFDEKINAAEDEDMDSVFLEYLYHQICSDEKSGVTLFQSAAEELSQQRLVNRLQILVNDTSNFPLKTVNGKLWVEYYSAKLAAWETRWKTAEEILIKIVDQKKADPKLRAYALSDLGYEWARWQHLGKDGGIEKAIKVLTESLELVPLDFHLSGSYSSLAHVFQYMGDWDNSIICLEKANNYYQVENNYYGIAKNVADQVVMNWHIGDVKKIHKILVAAQPALSNLPENSHSKALVFQYATIRLLTGRYTECENVAKKSLSIATELGLIRERLEPIRWLAWTCALQSKFEDAIYYCNEHFAITDKMGEYYIKDAGHGHEIFGIVLALQGNYRDAENHLMKSLNIKEQVNETLWRTVTFVRLGSLGEMRGDWNAALNFYKQSLNSSQVKQKYFHTEALTGLLRAKSHLGQYEDDEFTSIVMEAEMMATQYEFNDHLASIRLTQGIIENNQPKKLILYQNALIYGLRYNRFLLDEVLTGRELGTCLSPIISDCLENKEVGLDVLKKLKEWWITSNNNTGYETHDTVTPISEGVSLLDAEKLARKHEPGDGASQKTVLEQLDAAIEKFGNLKSNPNEN